MVIDALFVKQPDLREELYIHGLNIDTPFIVLADERKLLTATSATYGVISRPLTDAGIQSLLIFHGLPIYGETLLLVRQNQTALPSLLYALPHEYRNPLTDIIGQAFLSPRDLLNFTAARLLFPLLWEWGRELRSRYQELTKFLTVQTQSSTVSSARYQTSRLLFHFGRCHLLQLLCLRQTLGVLRADPQLM